MKALIVLAILFAIGVIVLMYKRENDVQKMAFSFFILLAIIGFAVIGNVMRSVMPLFLAHIIALIIAYGGLIYYVFKDKTQWILWLLPLATLVLYLAVAWIGNKHIIWFS
jgi:predicted membrane channel-forming protein YqfA (hemolysin III family)